MDQVTTEIDAEYEAGLRLYDEEKPLGEVLAFFEELRQRAPTDVRVAVSLGWLHILLGNKQKALFHCREAKGTVQGRFNLVLAYLTFGEKGVRERFEEALATSDHDDMHDAMENLRDAIARKGGSFKPAEKMLAWLDEVHKPLGGHHHATPAVPQRPANPIPDSSPIQPFRQPGRENRSTIHRRQGPSG